MPPDQLAWLAQSVISPPPLSLSHKQYLNIIPHYCVAHCTPSLIGQPFRFHFMDSNAARHLAQLGERKHLIKYLGLWLFPCLIQLFTLHILLIQLPNNIIVDSILTVKGDWKTFWEIKGANMI